MELGAGMVHASVPHYPGSDQSNTLTIPFPTIIYRGERLRADEEGGVRTRFFYNEHFELNLSLGGALPVSAKDNKVREGMPKLDTMIELGPGLIIHLKNQSNSKRWRLALSIPLRQAFSTNITDTYQRGLVFNPLLYSFYEINRSVTIFSSVSSRWATKDFHSYLYSVEQKDQNSNRAHYEAQGGHVLLSYSLALLFKYKNFKFFTGVSLFDATNNANMNSPLFIKKRSYSYAIGFSYFFYKEN